MDRNLLLLVPVLVPWVALRKESVDRNTRPVIPYCPTFESLSARRAWIEILQNCCPYLSSLRSLSARRAWIEIGPAFLYRIFVLSLSARRAWIEIRRLIHHLSTHRVALRKESVDRNLDTVQIIVVVMVALRKESVDRNIHYSLNLPSKPSRSPQGERG